MSSLRTMERSASCSPGLSVPKTSRSFRDRTTGSAVIYFLVSGFLLPYCPLFLPRQLRGGRCEEIFLLHYQRCCFLPLPSPERACRPAREIQVHSVRPVE